MGTSGVAAKGHISWFSCLVLIALAHISCVSGACDQKFEGFGIFLGSNDHFGRSPPGTAAKVLDVVYNFLGIRLFRTSYEESFSPEEGKYEINCTDAFSCSWVDVHRIVSQFPDAKVFASVWSPPHYMKNKFYQLLPRYETQYLDYLRNITSLVQRDFNITIEKISPVNEPENIFAPWDHTNMSPDQLCRIIKAYDDPLVSICPENSYFWVSRIYYNFKSINPKLNCSSYCDIQGTHAYALNLDFSSSNSLLAYYDLKPYTNRGTTSPIWMTEVSSTYANADQNQMQEGMDLARNIINFVGTTCVQRYYFWYAYTLWSSGESLIWGDSDGNLTFPKKFFVYKQFLDASNTTSNGPVDVNNCDNSQASIVDNLACIQFGDSDRILVNTEIEDKPLLSHECSMLCCTTETEDYSCGDGQSTSRSIPGKSVCHCTLSNPVILNNGIM